MFLKWKSRITIRLYSISCSRGLVTETIPRKERYRILFLGSDDFSIQSLKAVAKIYGPPSKIDVVVSNLNNTLAKYVKGQESNSVLKLNVWDDFKSRLLKLDTNPPNTFEFDLGVVSSFGHLVPSKVINQCQMGILNVHGSLLPRWRGAAPTAAAIMNGDDVTGVSIMKIAPHRFDIGPILHRIQIPLDCHIRTPELTSLLATVGAEALSQVLENLGKYLPIALPQEDSQATKAPKLTPEIGYVQWEEMDALEIYNLFRGISGRYKLRTNYQGRIVDLDHLSIMTCGDTDLKSDYSNFYGYPLTVSIPPDDLNTPSAKPGDILFRNKVICVKCQCSTNELQRHWIFIRKFKINQKWITALDFKNGWLSKAQGRQHFNSIDVLQIKTASKT